MTYADMTITTNEREELVLLAMCVREACEAPQVSAVEADGELWRLRIQIAERSDLQPFFGALGPFLTEWWAEQQEAQLTVLYHEGRERPWEVRVQL